MIRSLVPAALAIVLGCDSTALSLGDPNEVNVELVPAYMQRGGEPVEVVMTFTDADPDDRAGTVTDNRILDADLGDGLFLRLYTFESNFRVRLLFESDPDATPYERTLTLRIRNHYGTFLARGTFFLLE